MVGKFIIAFIALLFLGSCAQIGTVSGGDNDFYAPKPIVSKSFPMNKSTNFNGNQVSITFDEYFKLVSPSQNIVIIPPHATIDAIIRKKTLLLSWDDTLMPNTTYSIYINGAIQDITEGNDSTYQYVFSTGDELDSIGFNTFIVDAISGEPIEDASLICYNSDGELVSFAKSDYFGEASIQFLKPGAYTVLALLDLNNNLIVDKGEPIGFQSSSTLELSSTMTDSSAIRIFKPASKPSIRSAVFSSPSSLLIGATQEIKSPTIWIDETKIDKGDVKFLDRDSLLVFTNNLVSGHHKLVLNTEVFSDTINFRVPKKVDSSIVVSSVYSLSGLAPSDSIHFKLNDKITSVNRDSISIVNLEDSSKIANYTLEFNNNDVIIFFDRTNIREADIVFGDNAISCSSGNSKSWKASILFNQSRSYGTLVVDLSSYEHPLVLKVNKSDKTVRVIPVSDPSQKITISELPPADYSFSVIVDENANGKWDTGDFNSLRQPEVIDQYSTTVTVRANWDLEVPLVPNSNR